MFLESSIGTKETKIFLFRVLMRFVALIASSSYVYAFFFPVDTLYVEVLICLLLCLSANETLFFIVV